MGFAAARASIEAVRPIIARGSHSATLAAHRPAPPKCRAATIQYSYRHTPSLIFSPWSLAQQDDGIHGARYQQRLARLPSSGLWWTVISFPDISLKACVRRWARQRLRRAFEKAMLERGLDAIGNVQQSYQPSTGLTRSLTGSLRLRAMPPILTYTDERLTHEVSAILDYVVKASAIGPAHRPGP